MDTLMLRREDAVLFARISSPPMNLLGPELVRDLVSLIQRSEADDTVRVVVFQSADPDYFIALASRARRLSAEHPYVAASGCGGP